MTTAFQPTALSGKQALVTGASRGIGAAIAQQLVAMGAEILIADVNLSAADAMASQLKAAGGVASAVLVDLSDRAATRELAATARGVDILVNNAAPLQTSAAFVEIPDDEWEVQFAVIMWAPLILTRAIGAAMAERGYGAIVNILSTAARNPAPFVAPYAAAKASLEIITKVAALEFGPRGVRSNGVAPTFVPTERNRPVWERVGFVDGTSRSNPAGRMATAQDIAGVVGWLVSDAAAYVNGQTITVDGGASAGVFVPRPQ